MLSNPIIHSQIISGEDEGWVWLCTGSGYSYINFNADGSDNKEPPSHPPESSNLSSCCLYDAVPELEFSFLRPVLISHYLIGPAIYQRPCCSSFAHFSARAPPRIVS